MRILDKQGQEISLEDVDFSLGYLKQEELFIESLPEIKHYRVLRFNFDDNSSYIPTSENDPHIQIIDAVAGKFSYLPDEGETRSVKGMSIGLVIDQEAHDVYETIQRYILYTEEELVQRELPNRVLNLEDSTKNLDQNIKEVKEDMETNNETINNSLTELHENVQEAQNDIKDTNSSITATNENVQRIQNSSNQRMDKLDEDLTETNLTVEDLILLMAEVLGGTEEEIPEEESEPEPTPEEESTPEPESEPEPMPEEEPVSEEEPTPEETPAEDPSLEEPIE